jgi:MFS family permease
MFAVSEVVGRKPIYCISLFFYFIFTLPSCLANNIATMLAGRMVSQFFYNLWGLQADARRSPASRRPPR